MNMGVDILAAVQAQRLASVQRSLTSSENYERRVAGVAARTAAMLSGGVVGGHTEHVEEYMLRDTYYRVLEEYTRKPGFGTHEPFTPRGLALWKRAAKALKASGADREAFVRAQFTWFHDTFRKAPTPLQLTTDEAVVRAATVAPKAVRTVAIEDNVSVGDLFKRCEKQMGDLMRAQKMSREDVYRKLVVPGLAIFPEKFLNADPLWHKVRG